MGNIIALNKQLANCDWSLQLKTYRTASNDAMYMFGFLTSRAVHFKEHLSSFILSHFCQMYEDKSSKICSFWTFWPVIQLVKDGIITELSTKISRSAVFAICIARILNAWILIVHIQITQNFLNCLWFWNGVYRKLHFKVECISSCILPWFGASRTLRSRTTTGHDLTRF